MKYKILKNNNYVDDFLNYDDAFVKMQELVRTEKRLNQYRSQSYMIMSGNNIVAISD